MDMENTKPVLKNLIESAIDTGALEFIKVPGKNATKARIKDTDLEFCITDCGMDMMLPQTVRVKVYKNIGFRKLVTEKVEISITDGFLNNGDEETYNEIVSALEDAYEKEQQRADDKAKADLITIGGILNDKIATRCAYTDMAIAEIFMKALHGKMPNYQTIHYDMKDLSMGDLTLATLTMVRDLEHLVYTQPITVRTLRTVCTVQVFDPSAKDVIGNRYGAWIAETLDTCETRFAVINRLESRRKNAGDNLLVCVLNALTGIPVFLQAGYLYKGDAEMETPGMIGKLIRYYERLGFTNINDQYGYQNSAIMRHDNMYRMTISPMGTIMQT